jgi:hypothetical protein
MYVLVHRGLFNHGKRPTARTRTGLRASFNRPRFTVVLRSLSPMVKLDIRFMTPLSRQTANATARGMVQQAQTANATGEGIATAVGVSAVVQTVSAVSGVWTAANARNTAQTTKEMSATLKGMDHHAKLHSHLEHLGQDQIVMTEADLAQQPANIRNHQCVCSNIATALVKQTKQSQCNEQKTVQIWGTHQLDEDEALEINSSTQLVFQDGASLDAGQIICKADCTIYSHRTSPSTIHHRWLMAAA